MKAIRLRTEYLKNPIGLGTQKPRLFWNCEEGIRQTAYKIIYRINDKEYETKKIISENMYHDWESETLSSRDVVSWKVILWDEEDAEGELSEAASFEMGLLEETDWSAKWISGNYKAKAKENYPVDVFFKSFYATDITKARIYATACGIYDISLNHKRVGDMVLTPGATDPRCRCQVQVYDVTSDIREGENELCIHLAGGWYKSYLISNSKTAKYGSNTKVILQLELVDSKGFTRIIGTDDSFLWTNSTSYRFAENKAGESIDYRKEAVYKENAIVTLHPVQKISSDNVPMKEHEVFGGEIIHTDSGQRVISFQQNITGFLECDIRAKEGQAVNLYFGELIKDGKFTQENINPDKKNESRFQKVEIICKDGLNQYKTRFAIYGFQYVLIDGPVDVQIENIKAIAVYSDMDETAEFHTDDELIQKFVNCTRWSAKNNFADVPTDCPTRERVGWTGDAQVFYNTAAYFFDFASFSRKYIRDIMDAQHKNGCFTGAAPRCSQAQYMNMLDGAAGWADAGVLIPYRMWKSYGDDRIIRDNYKSIKAYGDYLIRQLGKKAIHFKRPKIARKYQKYLVMKGFSYGEWLEPKEAHDFDFSEMAKPHVEESSAYTYYSLKIIGEMAEYLGYEEDSKYYKQTSENVKEAYQALIQTEEYKLDTDRQAKLVRPLYMGLLDEKQSEFAKKRLLQAVKNFGYRVGTGFLSTPFLLFVLEKIDLDTAYRMLENTDIPGWLAMPLNNATTIWENWEGTLEEHPVSLNHYSKGAVCEWIFSEMCGVQIRGNRLFRIAPHPGGSIKYASLNYKSIYGEVSCSWEKKEDDVFYEINIPPNTEAEVIIGGETVYLSTGKYKIVNNVGCISMN